MALTNYANLTINMKLAGAPTDFLAIDPVGVFYMQVSASAQAPHPNAARLGANFILSQEGETLLTRRGRIPSRPDVETNPPGVLKALEARKVLPIVLDTAEEKKADALFKELIARRSR
jgi:ABC-type Fe3+ transport system substrate-binding protein